MTDKRAIVSVLDRRGVAIVRSEGKRVFFGVEQSMAETPDTLMIKAYGLSDSDMGEILSRGRKVLLYAGSLSTGLIGSGEIASARRMKDQEGEYLSIVGVDGDELMGARVNRAIAGGASLADLVRECVAHCGVDIGIGFLSRRLEGIACPRGAAIAGPPMDVLRDVARAADAAFFVRHGLIYIVGKDELVGELVDLDEERLLGTPSLEGGILHVSHDIESKIMAGSAIRFIRGGRASIYRVARVKSTGDTQANVWNMACEFIPLNMPR